MAEKELDRDDLEQEGEQEQEEESQYVSKEDYDKLASQLGKLKEAQKKSNKEAQKRREKLNDLDSRLQQYGLSTDDYDSLEEALAAAKSQDGKEDPQKGDIEKLRKQFEEDKRKAIEERDQQLRQMEGTVNKFLVENQASQAITEYDGVPKLLMPHIKEAVSVQKTDNGEYAVRVLDEDGDPRFNNSGEYMSIKDLVAEMRESEDFGQAFKAKAPSGSGSDPSGKKGGEKGPPKNMKRSEMTDKQKEDYIKKHGSDAYFDLPLS